MGGIIQDDRTPEEIQQTAGFWVATDKFMSGWGGAPGRSIVACPIQSHPKGRIYGYKEGDFNKVENNFKLRKEFIRVRYVSGKTYKPKMRDGDHLHIYDFESFRY